MPPKSILLELFWWLINSISFGKLMYFASMKIICFWGKGVSADCKDCSFRKQCDPQPWHHTVRYYFLQDGSHQTGDSEGIQFLELRNGNKTQKFWNSSQWHLTKRRRNWAGSAGKAFIHEKPHIIFARCWSCFLLSTMSMLSVASCILHYLSAFIFKLKGISSLQWRSLASLFY